MRLRNNPQSNQILEQSPLVLKGPIDLTNKVVRLEVGTGKGDFIIGMALKNPDIIFIGIEKFGTVLVKALRKIEELGLTNVYLINTDAKLLPEFFKPNSIDTIYLNFSDPWPKKRHFKRRLTYKSFLSIYESLLKPEGYLKIKTDNKGFFESSVESLDEYPAIIEFKCLDLHASERASDNVMSEYEKKFTSLGMPIYAIDSKFKKGE